MHTRLLEELEEIFRVLSRKINSNLHKNTESGLTGSQALLLEILETQGPKRVSDLANELNITLPSVTGLSDRLIAGGYVERKRSEKDRRIVLLEITEKGRETLQKAQLIRKELMKKFYECLSAQDIEDLIRIYSKMLANIR
ncbi:MULTISPECIES: MarR family winged helix-turn-helix transcriptional regulator [Aneurinibacillus]|nr:MULTISPECIES: MarR family transcriptional regulator [Aneurinibacillus]AMA73196.1 hypothetical protein ACH33_10205 [Aneurinibacillus sp. XH2]MED0674378.1 MarR family transcriptional regulator [Aneurinibacillus thermoaerophilus]MED0678397.1 MarR family transcriptional regulator [Aneurinibacillus thermoaerophilus]MED0736079.1 MarR family transcriptional regulator [Aneurinibacillus thermoaerophilus]MED0758711.1 MarR family transcriptional regulator [Aneurinibacillus thermoaerophilus]